MESSNNELSDGEVNLNQDFGEHFTTDETGQQENGMEDSDVSNQDGQVASGSSSSSNGNSGLAGPSDASESFPPSNEAPALSNNNSNSNTTQLRLSTSLTLKLINQLNENSKLSQQNLVTREKRCRQYEQESNELRELICSMNHMVHILENIKRISRDYIHELFELLGATLRHDNEQVEQLHQEVDDLESELKQWERKYHVMSSFNASNGAARRLATLFSSYGINVANQTASSAASSEQCQDEDNLETGENPESAEVETTENKQRSQIANSTLTSPSASVTDSAPGTNSSMMLIPPELCEMSMETHDGDSMTLDDSNTSDHVPQSSQARAAAAAAAAAAAIMMNPSKRSTKVTASSPLIAAAVAAATAATANQKQFGTNKTSTKLSGIHASSNGKSISFSNSIHKGNGIHGSSGSSNHQSSSTLSMYNNPTSMNKPLFRCDYDGCDYTTNMRQRLAMHKRAHAGEMLYTCDIPGCGYQSNYKGNIKIHKKHKHRLELGLGAEPTSAASTAGGTNGSSGINNSKNSSKPKPSPRGRKRKHGVTANPLVINVETLRHFVGLKQEPTSGDGQVSSCDIYSGNESGAKDADLPLYECPVDGCNYRSKWKQCLTAHQFLHAGVKPFKCDYPGCNYRTNFKGNVNVHKRVHRTSEFQCKFPGCTFTTPWKNSFVIHQRNHLQSIGTESDITPSISISVTQPKLSTVTNSLMQQKSALPTTRNMFGESPSATLTQEKQRNSSLMRSVQSTNGMANHIPNSIQPSTMMSNASQNSLNQMDEEEDEEDEEEMEDEDEEEDIEEDYGALTFDNGNGSNSVMVEQDDDFGSDLLPHMVNEYNDYHNSLILDVQQMQSDQRQ